MNLGPINEWNTNSKKNKLLKILSGGYRIYQICRYNLNPDSHKKVDTYIDESGRKISTEYEDDEISGTNRQILQSKIGRYLSKSKKTVSNVSKGMFP